MQSLRLIRKIVRLWIQFLGIPRICLGSRSRWGSDQGFRQLATGTLISLNVRIRNPNSLKSVVINFEWNSIRTGWKKVRMKYFAFFVVALLLNIVNKAMKFSKSRITMYPKLTIFFWQGINSIYFSFWISVHVWYFI